MSRRPLHATALSLALGCATWAGLSFAQSPAAAPAQAVQTLTVAEPGRPPEKCALLQAWRLDDGSPAMKVKSLATGEIMTVVEPIQSPATKDRFRVYRWGKSVVPPPGSPVPPQEAEERDETPARKWPSAHETVKTSTTPRTGSATTTAPRTQPSTPSAATRSPSGPAESQPKVVAPTPPQPWTASRSTHAQRKSETSKADSKTSSAEGETPARLASAVTAPPTPVSPAMDRNPAVPASRPVTPDGPAVTPLTKAPEPALPPLPPAVYKTPSGTLAASAPSKPAARSGSAEERPVKQSAPEKPAERLPAPAASEEPGVVSRSKPAVSLLPSEPPTPIVQVGAAAPGISTSRPISRPTPSVVEKPAVKAKQAPGTALDDGQVVSRTAPALSAYGAPVTPRRTGSDPLANPDQYVRLNKRDRDERTPLPVNSTLPSSALKVGPPAKPQAATVAKAGEKPSSTEMKVAHVKPPAAKPAPEPKREVVQASSKEVKPSAAKLERPEPPPPVAAVTAPPPPKLERAERQNAAQPVKRSTSGEVAKSTPAPAGVQSAPKETPVAAAPPVVHSEIRQVALVAPARAQIVKPMPAVDLSTLQGMVDLIKVLSDSGVAAHRQKAATDLGAVEPTRHPYVVAALTSAAKRDDTAQVRVAAIHSLKQMRSDSPTVKAAFEAGIADTDPRVRDAATEALRAFPEKRPAIQPVTGFSP